MTEKMICVNQLDRASSSLPTFTLLTYNCLASNLAEPQYFPHTDPKHLDFAYRSKLFEKEFRSFDPDVLCLQEMHRDDLDNWLRPFLSQFGYNEGTFAERGGDKARDGVVTFFKKDKFKLVEHHRLGYYDSAQAQFPTQTALATYNAALFCLLQFNDKNEQRLWICNTHLNWNYSLPATQLFQIRALLSELSRLNKQTPNSPFVLAGDFNSQRDSVVHDYLTNGILTEKASYYSKLKEVYQPLFHDDPTETTKYLTEPHSYKKELESAYNEKTFLLPFSTRIVDHFCGTIDFIYYQRDRLRPLQLLNPLHDDGERAQREDFTLPNEQHPSDHLPLMAELALLPYATNQDDQTALKQ